MDRWVSVGGWMDGWMDGCMGVWVWVGGWVGNSHIDGQTGWIILVPDPKPIPTQIIHAKAGLRMGLIRGQQNIHVP